MQSIRRLALSIMTLGASALLAHATIAPEALSPWPHNETLEAQQPAGWDWPFYIASVRQYQARLIVVLSPAFTAAEIPVETPSNEGIGQGQTLSADGKKVFLDMAGPTILAEYMTLAEYDASPLAEMSSVLLLYTAEQGWLDAYQQPESGWARSPFLGWVFLNHYPWAYQLETRQWLYFGEQERQLTFTFGSGEALPCWFKPFPEWNGTLTYMPVDNEHYDSVLHRFWSPKSGWLISDANLYPYCWSHVIEAWMLHRPAEALPTATPY